MPYIEQRQVKNCRKGINWNFVEQYAKYLEQASVCVRVLIVKLLLKKSSKMFEPKEIAEYIYEGVVEPSY